MFIKKILKNEKGAMDKILVTLLLVIVAIGALVGLETFSSNQKTKIINVAETKMEQVVSE